MEGVQLKERLFTLGTKDIATFIVGLGLPAPQFSRADPVLVAWPALPYEQDTQQHIRTAVNTALDGVRLAMNSAETCCSASQELIFLWRVRCEFLAEQQVSAQYLLMRSLTFHFAATKSRRLGEADSTNFKLLCSAQACMRGFRRK